jgi:hypothetical protein
MRSRLSILVAALFAICVGASQVEASTSLASKLSLRTTNGQLSNVGDAGGGSTSILGLNLLYSIYPLMNFSMGIGYQVDFDFSKGLVPLSGFNLPFRYYLTNSGTTVTTTSPELKSTMHRKAAWYTGAQLARREYFIGGNPNASTNFQQLSGSFINLDLLGGLDYTLSSRWELNAELQYSFYSFAASDSRFKIKATLLVVGLTYIW